MAGWVGSIVLGFGAIFPDCQGGRQVLTARGRGNRGVGLHGPSTKQIEIVGRC